MCARLSLYLRNGNIIAATKDREGVFILPGEFSCVGDTGKIQVRWPDVDRSEQKMR